MGMAKKIVPCPFPYMPVPYGCYCGPMTKTNSDPVDDFDELCKRHDECYTEVEQQGCKNLYDEYIAPYSWKLIGGENEVLKDESPNTLLPSIIFRHWLKLYLVDRVLRGSIRLPSRVLQMR